MTIKAYRAGETARHWTKDVYDEKLTSAANRVIFRLKMPSKGGGVTEVQLEVSDESFESISKAMVEANVEAAARAFVRTESFGFIASAMMEYDEDHALAAFSLSLSGSNDRTIRACGDILHDKFSSRQISQRLEDNETIEEPLLSNTNDLEDA
jgi:hypothetical protein